jgi:glutamine synthetase
VDVTDLIDLDSAGIDTVETGLVDLTGALRGKRMPVQAFRDGGLAGDVGFCSVVFAWDYAADVLPDDTYTWSGGYPDIFVRPDLTSLRPLAWRPGAALVLCDAVDETGAPVEVSPRWILRRAHEQVRAAGYDTKVGLEIEFYLVDARTRRPSGTRNPVYSLHDGSEHEPVLAEIRAALLAGGVEVEACGPEYGAGQVEITLRYDEPVRAADTLTFFRYAVKQIAARNGLLATFMARPFADISGSGLHVHQSLWRHGTNAFWDTERGGLSAIADHYLAGLLRYAPDCMAVAVPTPNGYRRMVPHSFAPTTVSWGTDNRCTAVRALRRGAAGTRLELRTAAADANPYLVVATALMAGLAGIQDAMTLPPEVKDDAYRSACPPLPSDLPRALDLLASSAFARSVLGTKTCELLTEVGEREIELYRNQVSDWERTRYLEAV